MGIAGEIYPLADRVNVARTLLSAELVREKPAAAEKLPRPPPYSSPAVPPSGHDFRPEPLQVPQANRTLPPHPSQPRPIPLPGPMGPLAVVIARRTAWDGTHPVTRWTSVPSSSSIQFQNRSGHGM